MARADDVIIYIKTDDSKVDAGLNSAERKINSFGSNLSKKLVGYFAGAFAVERIVSFTGELVKLGGELQGVERAFGRIADRDYLARLKESTHGTVSELELMRRAVQANNFDIPLSSLGRLFEFATARAQDTGESVDYLVNSIIMGIGRKSPLILDNLGISAVQLREKLKGVGTEAASVGDIAEIVGQIAEEALGKTGGVVDDEGIQLQQTKALWEDLKATWSQTIQQSGAIHGGLTQVNNDLTLANSKLPWLEKAFYRATFQFKKGAERAREYDAALAAMNETSEISGNVELDAITVTAKKITTYEGLKQQIKEARDNLDKLNIEDTAAIRIAYQEIRALEAKKAAFEALSNPTRAAINMPKMQSKGTPEIQGPGVGDILAGGLADMSGFTEQQKQRLQEMYDELQMEIDRLNQELNMSIVRGIVGGLEAGLSGANFGGIMSALLSPLAGILEKEGEVLIATGLGLEAFKTALSTLQGVPAIAVGTMLIGAAQAMKALGRVGSGGGGSFAASTAGGSFSSGGAYSSQSNQSIDININGRFEAEGDSLVYVLNKANYRNNRTRAN